MSSRKLRRISKSRENRVETRNGLAFRKLLFESLENRRVLSAAPIVDLGPDQSANEGSPVSLAGAFTDPDVGDTHTFLWHLDSASNGQVVDDVTTQDLDFTPENNGTYTFSLTVTDSENLSDTDSITVTVDNVAPTVFLSGATLVDEGQTRHYTFNTSDPGDDTFSLVTITCGPNGILSNQTFDSMTGAGAFDCRFPDGNAQSDLFVQVQDSDGELSNLAHLEVQVRNVGPTVILSGPNVAEEGQTIHYTFTATDPGQDSFDLVNRRCGETGMHSNFTLNPVTGSGSFDCVFPNGPATEVVFIQLEDNDDQEGNVSSITVTIQDSGPTNTAPVITPNQSFTIPENSPNAAVVGTALATDDHSTTFENWTIVGGSGLGLFAIHATSGQITVSDSNQLDRESVGSFELQLTVSDGEQTSAVETVTINLTDQNDVVPVITNGQSFSVNENSSQGTLVGTVQATDGDVTPTTFQNWAIVGGNLDQNENGLLPFAINPSTGQITVNDSGDINYELVASYNLMVQVSDGVNLSVPTPVLVSLNNVNEAPVNSVPSQQAAKKNTPLTMSSALGNAVSVADVDAGSSSISVTLSVTNGTLTLASTTGLTFSTGDGTNDSNLSFTGTIDAINTALDGMRYTPAHDFTGTSNLTITSNDLGNSGSGGSLSDTDTVSITVTKNAQPILILLVSDEPDPVVVGQQFEYRIFITNNSGVPALDLKLDDKLGTGVTFQSATWNIGSTTKTCPLDKGTVKCKLGTLPSGQVAFISVVVLAPNVPGVVTNTTILSAKEIGSHTFNQTTTVVAASSSMTSSTNGDEESRSDDGIQQVLEPTREQRDPDAITSISLAQIDAEQEPAIEIEFHQQEEQEPYDLDWLWELWDDSLLELATDG